MIPRPRISVVQHAATGGIVFQPRADRADGRAAVDV
jgi:hypothetical protein